MDQMVPSPGFSIPSIGTPVHQPEEDQQIIQTPPLQPQDVAMSICSLQIQQQPMNKIYETNNMGYASPHNTIRFHIPVHQSMPSLTPISAPTSVLPVQQIIQNPALPTQMTPKTPSADPKMVPQIQNIVSTVNLGCQLDLKLIALHARNSEYNPKRFSAVIMRIREPRTTALIFSSGKIVCTGAKSEEDSKLAARKYARIIQKLGFPAVFLNFKIQNMVGSCDVRFPIRLEGLVLTHGQFCSYEPELFPGLVYRMVKPHIVLLIFVSGKIVLTGARVRQEIYDAYNNIYPILKSFKKKKCNKKIVVNLCNP